MLVKVHMFHCGKFNVFKNTATDPIMHHLCVTLFYKIWNLNAQTYLASRAADKRLG